MLRRPLKMPNFDCDQVNDRMAARAGEEVETVMLVANDRMIQPAARVRDSPPGERSVAEAKTMLKNPNLKSRARAVLAMAFLWPNLLRTAVLEIKKEQKAGARAKGKAKAKPKAKAVPKALPKALPKGKAKAKARGKAKAKPKAWGRGLLAPFPLFAQMLQAPFPLAEEVD